jgi:hypothetical protein
MKATNPNSAKLLAAWWFNGAKKLTFDVFLFFVGFVALQVMTRGAWWVSFSDGAQSLLLNENFTGVLCIRFLLFLQGDWQEDFCTAKGWGDEEYIWCRLRKKGRLFWWWRKTKWRDFQKTKRVCRIWILEEVRRQKDGTFLGWLDQRNPDSWNSTAPRVTKRSSGLVCFFVGTNTRERMIVSRISRMVVWEFICDNLGDFQMMNEQYVPS